MLKWARTHKGLSAVQLADLIKQSETTVLEWEANTKWPTLRQLENLAETLKIPLAVFFFAEEPDVSAPTSEFRMLPEALTAAEARDTSVAITESHARQLSILELTGGKNPAGSNFLFSRWTSRDPADLRAILGIPLSTQVSWGTAEDAFKEWRSRLEATGVIVFKRSLKQRSVSGFCLPHDIAPVIVVNNSTTWNRQIFTLFHELCHLHHHHHGVTRADHGYISSLPESELSIETECNRFAAQFLLPPAEFDGLAPTFSGTESEVENASLYYKVSREVILRRLRDLGRVSQETYEDWTERWNEAFFARPKPKSPGGNYYRTTASYLGQTYLRLAFSAYHGGSIGLVELAEHLGVKGRNLSRLEDLVEA